jgi:hypothetical protein
VFVCARRHVYAFSVGGSGLQSEMRKETVDVQEFAFEVP